MVAARLARPRRSVTRAVQEAVSGKATGRVVERVHPLRNLNAEEIRIARDSVRRQPGLENCRFSFLSLKEPCKESIRQYEMDAAVHRIADTAVIVPERGESYRLEVGLPSGVVVSSEKMAEEDQPLISPDECLLAESIVKKDAGIRAILEERYGLSQEELDNVVCDPWSVHIATESHPDLGSRSEGKVPRAVQTFMYLRDALYGEDDNHYAHPLDIVPLVDLHKNKVIGCHVPPGDVSPVPKASVNYHRNLLHTNAYLETEFRDPPAPLDIVQPDGPSFTVDEDQVVSWQKWKIRVGFNYREGLVLHDVSYDGRPVMTRGSLVEMAVPYADVMDPFPQKCAFDVGDYGLGYCANSLSLGCDCLGAIHYFDATLADSAGEPYVVKNAICMHEEDAGVLWKHMEYRNSHSESRRSRRLVLSSIATVVNYEYLFYWYFLQDGTIEFEIKLSGELSTNMPSPEEIASGKPKYGTLVAPNVNAQIHQHMFCMRLDMAIDGDCNTVSEIDVVPRPPGPDNPYSNAFGVVETTLKSEKEAQRVTAPERARTWKIANKSKNTAYKLIPFTKGPAQPTLLTGPDSKVTQRGKFATKNLFVTPYSQNEMFPAGDFTVQSLGNKGVTEFIKQDRCIEDTDIVLWHSFGVVHVPRPEDFPVMPVEHTGFTLKPDGFFKGNPSIDLPPTTNGASKCCT